MLNLEKITTAMFVFAHPDDEVLSCAGLIAMLSSFGCEVKVVFLADGVSSRGQKNNAVHRKNSAYKALEVLGVKPHLLPKLVVTHSIGDLNIDHKLVANAVATAARPLPGCVTDIILEAEVLSSSEWRPVTSNISFFPNFFVDISSFIELKVRALEFYSEEMRPFPHPRSEKAVRALATLRGSTIGVTAAEAFALQRLIVR